MVNRGFTLIETVTVLGLVMSLAAIGYAVSMAFLRAQSLENSVQLVTSQIELAQAESYMQKADASHGVRIFTDQVIRFTGSSYDTRDITLDVSVPTHFPVVITGDAEIVFPAAHLRPTEPFLTEISVADRSYEISVSSYGILEITKGDNES